MSSDRWSEAPEPWEPRGRIAVSALLDHVPFDPYRHPPWCDVSPLSVREVRDCVEPNPGRREWGVPQPRALHVARVAHLVRTWRNDGSDPPEVELYRGTVTVLDGWHRLAAAVARGDREVTVNLSGFVGEAHALGFTIVNEDEAAQDDLLRAALRTRTLQLLD